MVGTQKMIYDLFFKENNGQKHNHNKVKQLFNEYGIKGIVEPRRLRRKSHTA